MKLSEYKTYISAKQLARDKLLKDKKDCRTRIKKYKKELIDYKEAHLILQTVAKDTQAELEYRISELSTLALRGIFEDAYELVLEFVERRNSTEADLTLTKEKNSGIDPMSASGGGVVDIIAFALRVSMWSLNNPRSRPVLIFDEPFKFVSKDLLGETSRMLKEVSDKLGIQMIIVTHLSELLEFADKVFEVKMRKGISKVREV